jgi:aryl-alcohol dehydrogenase-like predicted oxidoreductase
MTAADDPAVLDVTPGTTITKGGLVEYRSLGRTGMQVSRLCLGTMMFGAQGNVDHDECVRIIRHAVDSGINFIDTADVYNAGESERIVGKALAGGQREDVVLATKVHDAMAENPNMRGNSRRWIMTEVENSLRRLRTDYLDLYQVHAPDPDADIDETLGAMSDLIRAGKIRYCGSSNFAAHQIVEAQWVSERRGRERFVSEQPPYSLLVRGIEADLLPVCERYGVGVMSWSPLGGGWLSGRYQRDRESPASRRAERLPERYELALNQNKLVAVHRMGDLADRIGVTLIHLALAFVLSHPAITSAIIGPRTMAHLESQLGAMNVALDSSVLGVIDEIVPPGTNVNPGDTPGMSNDEIQSRVAD